MRSFFYLFLLMRLSHLPTFSAIFIHLRNFQTFKHLNLLLISCFKLLAPVRLFFSFHVKIYNLMICHEKKLLQNSYNTRLPNHLFHDPFHQTKTTRNSLVLVTNIYYINKYKKKNQ